MELTQELAREFVDYNPRTGVLTWKARDPKWFKEERRCRAWNTVHAGKPVSTKGTAAGYPTLIIFGQRYYHHRFIFMWMTGKMPLQVDHDDGDKFNNRWANLNEADAAINQRNKPLRHDNKSGHIGVHWDKQVNKWRASIRLPAIGDQKSRQKTLGVFKRYEDAVAARRQASAKLNYNPNHGRSTTP